MVAKSLKLAVVGPFPPPVHGMAKNLKAFLDDASSHGDTIRIDLSPGSLKRTLGYHVRRVIRVVVGVVRYLSSAHDIKCLYMAPDGGMGLIYTGLFVLIARIAGHRIILHHRSFAYIYVDSPLMRSLVNVAGQSALHVFLCEDMQRQFRARYPGLGSSLVVSNAMHVADDAVRYLKNDPVGRDGDTLRLCFLSNLSEEKGIRRVVDVCDALISLGVQLTLRIGGAAENEWAERFSRNELSKRNYVDYRGYIDDKDAFFDGMDVLLFPTDYRNEAQPNVVFEAAARGVLSITSKRGCLQADVASALGWSIDLADYHGRAIELLKSLSSTRSALLEKKRVCATAMYSKAGDAREAYESVLRHALR